MSTEIIKAWSTPVVQEQCVGMEVTSYESAEIDGDGGTVLHALEGVGYSIETI